MKCFELHNVGLSAWGLAIHRDARLIAISSNSHTVKVLAYALSTSESTALAENHESLFPRDQNRYMTLRVSRCWVLFDSKISVLIVVGRLELISLLFRSTILAQTLLVRRILARWC